MITIYKMRLRLWYLGMRERIMRADQRIRLEAVEALMRSGQKEEAHRLAATTWSDADRLAMSRRAQIAGLRLWFALGKWQSR